MPTVLVDEQVHPSILAEFPPHWKLVLLTDNPSPKQLAEVDAYFVYAHPTVDRAAMVQMPKLKIVANFGVGVGHINLADAKAMGIPVTNTPGVLHHATADFTVGLILAATRHIVAGHAYATGPDFKRYDPHMFWGLKLYGATLGIIGMGEVGTQVAKIMNVFGMQVLYHNRKPVSKGIEREAGATYFSLHTVLRQSDVVLLTPKLTELTRNMIGPRELGLMRPTTFLVNTSRGAVLDHDALVTALREKRLAGAALDVTEPEPLPRDHPLLSMPNVIVTPHLGSATPETRIAMGHKTIDNIRSVLDGKGPLDPVL